VPAVEDTLAGEDGSASVRHHCRVHSLSSGEPIGRYLMKTSGIIAALPAQDLARAKAFYAEKVGLRAVESRFLESTDGRVGLTIGDGSISSSSTPRA
jgi:hypothetical protein